MRPTLSQGRLLRPPGRGEGPRGESRLGALVWILIGLLVIYAGSKFIPPYMTYLAMQDPVKEAALLAAAKSGGGEERARQQLLSVAKEQGIALDEEQIEISVDNQVLTLRVSWEEPVELPRYRPVLHFTIEKSVPAP